jgi:NADH:ubiquinone reductase (H+-translocating)
MRIVVLGGGYAGLACLARLARVAPRAERHLVDPKPWHTRRTLLHEALRVPLSALRADFAPIARRWNFRHHRVRIDWTWECLLEWSRTSRIQIGRREVGFDALVLTTGLAGRSDLDSRSRTPPVLLESLASGAGVSAFKRLAAASGPAWVVGAGASGLQCLFELAAARPKDAPLGLIEAEDTILAAEPEGLRREVFDRLRRLGVELRFGVRYAGFTQGRVRMTGPGGASSEPATAGVLLCTGPTQDQIGADAAGRVLHEERPLPGIFAAGDCSRWVGVPFDAATAQTAIRKGRHVAGTIARLADGREPEEWDARQLGFFLSLGPRDAVGWIFARAALVTGLPAIAAREAIETRWDMLLRGLDSFAAF